MRIGRQLDLAAAVGCAHPRTLHPDAAPAKRDFAGLAAVTDRDAIGISSPLRTDDLADLLFHQRVQHAEPDADRQRQQPVLRRIHELAQRLLHRGRQPKLAPVLRLLYGPHGGPLLRRG